ncbi:MAG: extracellular solute-binding protein [Burkholderiales bacterium]|nr:extracellular solute-binding protein [Burkholderiales bacterium]
MKPDPRSTRGATLAALATAAILASGPTFAADENVLTIYSGIPRNQAEAVVSAFSKDYGKPVSAKVLDSPVEELMAQARIEIKAGTPKADILWFDKPQLLTLSRESPKLLEQIESPHYGDLLDSVKTGDYRKLVPVGFVLYVLSYNTNKYSKETSPQSYADLLKPEYKGQIAFADPRSSAGIHNFFWLITDKLKNQKPYGWDYFREIKKNDPKLPTGHGAIRDLVISGERPIGIQFTFYLTGPIERGEKVGWNWPKEGVVAGEQTLGVIAKGSNQVAKDFAVWATSPKGQEVVAKLVALAPVSKKVDFKFPDGKTVQDIKVIPADAEAISKNRAEVVREFAKIMRQ